LLGLVGALPILAAERDASVPLIKLYTDFQHQPPRDVVQAIHTELDAILSPIGLTFAWQSLDTVQGNELSVRLAVIHFKGACDVQDLSTYPPYGFVLGRTQIVDGEILPFTDIFCNAIRAFVQPQLVNLPPGDREKTLGRAVARVLAHELHHIFAQTRHHPRHGFNKRAYSATELTEAQFRFTPGEYRSFRASLLPALLQVPRSLGAAAPPGIMAFVRSGCSGCHGSRGEGSRWAPALAAAARIYDFPKLATRLKSSQSGMYQRAQDLGVPWPALNEADITDLVSFLKSLTPAQAVTLRAGE
ncbi:MAG TPA: c-type cytochrome, partial [Bryobacteraceae bacterium]|nr:c-type cytochrome [Bryobacteraceae bacterium]